MPLPPHRASLTLGALCCALLLGCSEPAAEPQAEAGPSLRDSLLLRASFEDGMDASYARGDRRIYSAPSYDELAERGPGYWGENIDIAYDEGRAGHALRFKSKDETALFYTAQDNIAFSASDWTGTIAFFLRLDPDEDLEPGYCDPIQVTDSAYNDSAIWVDFTRDDPRKFRLGVFGELTSWNPDNTPPDDNPAFGSRLVVVDEPPFAADRWTHVAITHEGLGGGEGRALLYLDGEFQGESGAVAEPFEWDPNLSTIRLGVNYVGLFDELTTFDRALTAEEIRSLATLESDVFQNE